MADDNDNKDNSDKENVTYQRKKNIISGVDNDLLLWGTGLVAVGLLAAPYVRQWVDNVFRSLPQQGQLPPGQGQPANGGGVPQVLNPPEGSQHKVAYVEQEQQVPQQRLNPLEQHEKALADQAAYAAAMEKENLTGSQSISMVPERSDRQRSKYTYEAGSNVSAGYT